MKRRPESWREGLRISGYIGYIGCILCISGFIVIVVSDFLPPQDDLIRVGILSVGLGAFSLGLGFIAIALGLKSDERMKAMANLEFREKIAVMKAYMQLDNERIEQDLRAALELREWVKGEASYKEFKDSLDKFIENAKQKGNSDLYDLFFRLRKLRKEIDE